MGNRVEDTSTSSTASKKTAHPRICPVLAVRKICQYDFTATEGNSSHRHSTKTNSPFLDALHRFRPSTVQTGKPTIPKHCHTPSSVRYSRQDLHSYSDSPCHPTEPYQIQPTEASITSLHLRRQTGLHRAVRIHQV